MGKRGPLPRIPREPLDDEDNFESEDESGIEEFFSHPGAQRVLIRKIHTSGRRESCETASLEEITDDPAKYLRENYGAGLYECTLNGEKGRRIKTRRIHVAPKIEREVLPAPVAAPPVDSMNGKTDIVALLMQQNTHMQQLLLTAIKPADPAAMLTAMVAAFREVKNVSAPAGPAGSMSEARQLVEFARELSGRAPAREDGEEGGSDWGWVAEIGKRVVAALPNAAPPRAPAAAVPALQGGEAQEDQEMFFADLRQGVEMLVSRARAGVDPEVCASMVVGESSWSGPSSAVLEAIREGATISQLKTYVPGITPEIEAWGNRFYAAIQKSNGAGPGSAAGTGGNSGGTGGNLADASNHAGGSAKV